MCVLPVSGDRVTRLAGEFIVKSGIGTRPISAKIGLGKHFKVLVNRPRAETKQTNTTMNNPSVAHTSRIRVVKHEGPHRTATIENFRDPIHFGIHGGIKRFYKEKYGREITGPEYPATLDYMIAGVAG